ncbi:MAG: tetratricopeptide repeat-containing sulfotransferase family protein [Steroidobacteraceae bacterium]
MDDGLRRSGELVRLQPDSSAAWHVLSEAAGAARQYRKATAAARRAAGLRPSDLFLRAHLARCLLHQGFFRAALQCADEAWQRRPRSPFTCDLLGQVYAGAGEHAKALAAFEAAVSRGSQTHFQFNLATALRNVGQFDRAEQLYDRIVAQTPHDWEAYKNRTDLRSQTTGRNHIAELERLLADTAADWRGEVMICAALAKEYEDIGSHAAGFAYLQRCNAKRRQHLEYSVTEDLAAMRRLAAMFTEEALQRRCAGYPSEEPIFIVGLPRTGSTLIERMLGMHTQIFAAGELQNFPITCSALAGGSSDLGSSLLHGDPAALGRAYVESTRPRTGHTRFFIDKLPNNFLFVGAIHRALPRARIIHLVRHPVDTCYAIYKTLFKDAYPYSYDFDELAAYYIGYRQLMRHWRLVVPQMLEVEYEDLIASPERVIAKLLAYCGLEVEEACFRFFDSTLPTSTASASQVRRPIYNSSVGRWRNVARELEPLRELLRRGAVVID